MDWAENRSVRRTVVRQKSVSPPFQSVSPETGGLFFRSGDLQVGETPIERGAAYAQETRCQSAVAAGAGESVYELSPFVR